MSTATEIRHLMDQTIPAAERYVAGLQAFEDAKDSCFRKYYTYRVGARWTKIISEQHDSITGRVYGASVHAFIENATGNVYKAASWNAPAKGVRFLTVDDALAKAAQDPDRAFTGGYLYLNR